MLLSSAYDFNAPAQKVWDLLMDVEAVGACLPGCRGLKASGDDRYDVELGVAVAVISGNFTGTVALEEKVPPESYKLVVEGSGRQGFVKGTALVWVEADGDRTHVHVTAQADVGGMIARLGQRLLEGVAKATMDRFYACLAKRAEETNQ
jgi:carbon monoxide dehydrogenase subunit G